MDIAPRRATSWFGKKTVRITLMVVSVGAPLLLAATWPRPGATVDSGIIWQTVSRSDLVMTVIERGNLESQKEVEVFCEVEDVRRDGINGTPIVWIVPNGSSVEKGELIVEIESTPIREELDQQILETEEARATLITAQANFENQKTQNATIEADARLDIELAELELEMFQDGESGTYKLAVEEIHRDIDDVNNEILAAQANLELKRDDQRGIEQLFKMGYAGRSEVRRSQLSYLEAEGKYAATLNRLENQMATLRKKQNYERRMELLRLQGKLDTAKRNLQQVIRNNEAKLSQMEATWKARRESLKKEEELLERYSSQLEKCKIYAPQSGMIAYASDRSNEIREGAIVRFRQELLSIPDLSQMQVRTAVHESVLDKVEVGLPVEIKVDAFPDRRYTGTVKSVAVLPDQDGWLGSDTKVYDTVVTIDEKVEQLKPGMTAVTEIHLGRAENVISVPLQAVVGRGETTWAFVKTDNAIESREVKLGRSNETDVEVVSGLQAGEVVALNPKTLADRLLPKEDA